MRKFKNPLVVFLLAIFLAQSSSFLFANDETYHIGNGDVLDVAVWQTPDLTKTVTVNSKGFITYPYLGDLKVSGITPQQLEQTLKQKLAQGYVKDPQVSVNVKEYNSKKILVFGEVVQPGLFKLKGKIPLLEMLFMVGGVKGEAKRMTIIRPVHPTDEATAAPAAPAETDDAKADSGAKAIEINLISLLSKGDLSQNVFVEPGDTIYVSSGTGERYYVLGQVARPGPYEWVQDITVLEAIKVAEGALKGAALNRIMVRKKLQDGQDQIKRINVVDIMKGKKKDDVVVKPGDVIVVPESWI